MDDYLAENHAHWEDAAAAHPGTDHYDVESFLAGETTLRSVEREAVGDVSGKRLLHLQCHFGLDTLSWAREGAEATGVDFSGTAVETARELAVETGLDDRASFVRSDIYDLPSVHDDRYDVVVTTYGVLGWLPDLRGWAEVATSFLEPGGSFHLVEIHPITMTLPFDFDGGEARFEYPYFTTEEPLTWEGPGTYADESLDLDHDRSHNWPHGVGEILTALLDAGLELESVREHPFACSEQFPGMVEGEDGYWRFEADVDLPLLLSVAARRPA